MKTAPSFSRVSCIAWISVHFSDPETFSNRSMASTLTSERRASIGLEISTSARAARHCEPVITINLLFFICGFAQRTDVNAPEGDPDRRTK
jgi:hypothetical protein